MGIKLSKQQYIDISNTTTKTGIKIISFNKFVGNRSYWNCICPLCQKIFITRKRELTNGLQSCGCLRTKQKLEKFNRVGQKYGHLTVLELSEKKCSSGNYYWICECDCKDKNRKEVISSSLDKYPNISCGCQRRSKKDLIAIENRRDWPGRKKWTKEVLKKFDFKCIKCNRNYKLIAHHIYNYYNNFELRNDITNGVCFCVDCHRSFHNQYGNRKNDLLQVLEYLNIKL